MAFIVLAGGKIWDDWERLSLTKSSASIDERQFRNYMLTPREQEIATFLTKGMTYKQIAEQLYISIPTVKTHSSNIYKKCGVKNKNELTHLLIS
ncbi:MAG: response regulator transcription factor [Bacteroidota bacterium]